MFLFVLPVTPALLPAEKQKQEQEHEQEEEEDAPVCNYSSTNLSVLLLQMRLVGAGNAVVPCVMLRRYADIALWSEWSCRPETQRQTARWFTMQSTEIGIQHGFYVTIQRRNRTTYKRACNMHLVHSSCNRRMTYCTLRCQGP